MQLLDGKVLAARIRTQVQRDIATSGVQPTLATILVGDDPASRLYQQLKEKACQEVGIRFLRTDVPATTRDDDVLRIVHALNERSDVHGMLIQLPLPAGHNVDAVIGAMDPKKDVDGFHPENLRAIEQGRQRCFPVLLKAVLALIHEVRVSLAGKRVIILSKSDVFTRPFRVVFARLDAHVEQRETPDAQLTSTADVLLTALGRPRIVTADHVKGGTLVIDIGISPLPEGVVGDVDQESMKARTGWLTPVPGGVGPVTVAMLLENTAIAAGIALTQPSIPEEQRA